MPLVIPSIESKLKSAIFENLKKEFKPDISRGENYSAEAERHLRKIANAVAKGVAQVIVEAIQNDAQVAPGQAVVTSGSPSNHAGSVVSPGRIL